MARSSALSLFEAPLQQQHVRFLSAPTFLWITSFSGRREGRRVSRDMLRSRIDRYLTGRQQHVSMLATAPQPRRDGCPQAAHGHEGGGGPPGHHRFRVGGPGQQRSTGILCTFFDTVFPSIQTSSSELTRPVPSRSGRFQGDIFCACGGSRGDGSAGRW